jgi:hypothetical protein
MPPITCTTADHGHITSARAGHITLHPALKLPAYEFHASDLGISLISVADIADTGCTVTFTGTDCTISRAGTVLLTASRHSDRLYRLNTPAMHVAAPAIKNTHTFEHVQFLSQCFGNPPDSSIMTALARGYIQHNNLLVTAKDVYQNRPQSIATQAGHLKAQTPTSSSRIFHLSTIAPAIPTTYDVESGTFSDVLANEVNVDGPTTLDTTENSAYYRIIPSKDIIEGDLPGAFKWKSKFGGTYFLVTWFNGYIHAEIMPTRTKESHATAWKHTLEFFSSKGHNMSLVRTDNETSQLVQTLFKNHEAIAPYDHRGLKGENAVKAWKHHFIATLYTVDPTFPTENWEDLVPHSEDMLNLLRSYSPNNAISAYEGIHGHKYDFDAYPLAPLGCLVSVFQNPQQRTAWGNHSLLGYFIGHDTRTNTHHYKHFRCHVTATGGTVLAKTVAWHPLHALMPGSTASEILTAAIHSLGRTFETIGRNFKPRAGPEFETASNQVLQNLISIHDLYHPSTETNPVSPPVDPPGPRPQAEGERRDVRKLSETSSVGH